MDAEDIRIMKLVRAGRENIIKYGTYDLTKTRHIFQDHPFYVIPKEEPDEEPMDVATSSEEDASALAAQILSNNFKVGMSQSDVDLFLSGMTF